MRCRSFAALALPLLFLCASAAPAQHTFTNYRYPFQNPSLPTEDRINDLLSRMTLGEKVQALGTDPDVPRLGIVGTGHVEGLHGLALGGPGGWEGRFRAIIPTTTFPQSRGLGQTWDPALLRQAAAVEGFETRWADGRYHRGGLVVRAPNADLARDPRWGRSEESYGEDPFETGTLAAAFVEGLQYGDAAVPESQPNGAGQNYWLTSSLMKHFLANSNEDGRGGSSSNFDDRLFHEYYAVPFRMGIEQGHSNAFMTAYNAWNGIPMAAQPALKNIVMKDWGFDGIICTDAGALTNMVSLHHYYKSMPEAAAGAIHAGVNQFLDNYRKPVEDALAQGLVTEHDIDQDLRGVFRVMIRLGKLDPPSQVPYSGIGVTDYDPGRGDPWDWPEHRDLARKVTDESIVLLKNEHNTLPLDAAKLKSIAVIGPYADQVLLDWYSGTPPYAISPLEGIRKRVEPHASVEFAKGDDLAKAADLARHADVAIVIIGNHPTCNAGWAKCPLPSDGKEAIDRKSLTLEQEAIARAVFAANPHTIEVLNASFPYTTTWSQANLPAIVEMTHNSQEEGTGLADVLFGDYNPAGRLTQTWVASEDQLPPMMDYDIRHGRTYMYLKQKPLYAFGYGLSYTTFGYSQLALSSDTLRAGGTLNVSFDLRNTGRRDGDEVAQLYVAHIGSSVPRAIEELRGFERVHLTAGESKHVTLALPANALRYWDAAKNQWVLEPDQVEIRIGASSDDIRLRKIITVTP
jgi:beta-glucosidase